MSFVKDFQIFNGDPNESTELVKKCVIDFEDLFLADPEFFRSE